MGQDKESKDTGQGRHAGKLTQLQQLFVEHWFECRYNATEAASRAGYEGNRQALAERGSKLLRMDKIRAAIAARFGAHGGSSEEVIAGLLDIARFADPSRYLASAAQLDYEAVKKWGRHLQAIHKTKDGWRVQVYSRKDALAELGRIMQAGDLLKQKEQPREVRIVFAGEGGGEEPEEE